MPIANRTEVFDATGSLINTSVSNFRDMEFDGDKHLTKYTIGSSELYFKY